MPGFTPKEGRKIAGRLLCLRDLTDRIADLEVGLYTNASVSDATVHADITEPTGTGYARKTLTDASWVQDLTGTNPIYSYAVQTFIAGAGGWTGSIRGFFVCTKGATKHLLSIEPDTQAVTLAENETYEVEPKLQFEQID